MENLSRKLSVSGWQAEVNLNKPLDRFINNPILTCHQVNGVWTDPKYQVKTVHNVGIAQYRDEVVMLFRSHLRNGISVIGTARSNDGVHGWKVDPKLALKPCNTDDLFADGVNIESLIENEAGGVEDPRVSKIGANYFITYSAYHGTIKDRVRVSLATTTDFRSFVRHGPLMDVDMRNVVIFPEQFGGKYAALFRPNDHNIDQTGGVFKEIQIGFTKDLFSHEWDLMPEPLMKQEGGPSAFSDKIGPGAPPIKTKYGWLNIFHGVRGTMDGNPYTLGIALHDLNDPQKVQVSNIPILFPSAADCKTLPEDYIHVPNVVFCCGALRRDDGSILIYYGGNDTVTNVAVTHEDILVALCENYPQNPLSGEPAYVL
ncbi:glycosidase [Ancylomarina sp. 16SWW S1-10-2]|uniref:glycoside hydrolase family 130 protein n=1 Tax=Ancylomarina sp. 16SWW S1-10-2 TaxID=2499681 RepID=UPI0012ADB213|nr:glycosidase [Ancylomarina sp. 16SWW S1-10-2]MRT93037.1 glycosidase [Ancylomarina sp. 16SWW S1-10-2]